MKKASVFILLIIIAIFLISGCEGGAVDAPAPVPAPDEGYAGDQEPVANDPGADPAADGPREPEEPGIPPGQGPEYIRNLLEEGAAIENLSYTAIFHNEDGESTYEYYKRGDMTKIISYEEESQYVSISDGYMTVFYSLPDRVGHTLMDTGGDMGDLPGVDALLNEDFYTFLSVGEESVSGHLCLVVETEDESGALKIWISKALGLPVKYIGTDDNGWYSLELRDIRLDELPESEFQIPSDVVMNY